VDLPPALLAGVVATHPRDGGSILLRQTAVENWGAGGRAASDYDPRFEISV
jgi:hypothetical protein